LIEIEDKEFAEEVPILWFLVVIEQKKILILCFSEEKTDSTKLRFPKDFVFIF
jgi:hypothetical protein